jgi:hypothetical protein
MNIHGCTDHPEKQGTDPIPFEIKFSVSINAKISTAAIAYVNSNCRGSGDRDMSIFIEERFWGEVETPWNWKKCSRLFGPGEGSLSC